MHNYRKSVQRGRQSLDETCISERVLWQAQERLGRLAAWRPVRELVLQFKKETVGSEPARGSEHREQGTRSDRQAVYTMTRQQSKDSKEEEEEAMQETDTKEGTEEERGACVSQCQEEGPQCPMLPRDPSHLRTSKVQPGQSSIRRGWQRVRGQGEGRKWRPGAGCFQRRRPGEQLGKGGPRLEEPFCIVKKGDFHGSFPGKDPTARAFLPPGTRGGCSGLRRVQQ